MAKLKIVPDVVTIQDILIKQGIDPDLATQATEVLAEYWESLCQIQQKGDSDEGNN